MAAMALTCAVLAEAEQAPIRNPRRPPLHPPRSALRRQPPLIYHGGTLLKNPTIYYIWYGDWTPAQKAILETLATHFSGTPYANILTTYYDSAGTVPNSAVFGGSAADNYSVGRSLSDLSLQTIVDTAIVNHSLPLDLNGIYFILAAADVNEVSGFCTKYCGFHKNAAVARSHLNIAFIGNPAVQCPNACEAQSISPNNDAGVDSAASVVAHELEESITDPSGSGWYDVNGDESADKCAYTYGATTRMPNGSLANIQLGGLNYLIQQNWVNIGAGHCAMAH
jgi:hypothetical protein